MMNHIIILMLSDTKIEKSIIIAKVFQNSLLSSILYLFYIAELLDNSQRIWHLSAHSQSLTWSQAVLKQTCKDDQAQDDHSDQCSASHYNFHLRNHFHQHSTDLQCYNQISAFLWVSSLTSFFFFRAEDCQLHSQEHCSQVNRYTKQMSANSLRNL